tara:strand:- start:336 stop:1967 length:1632 start_codon:yes stop_codon:yes gene_type:complete
MVNRYTRALKQIKDKSIDEKLKLVETPTNNTQGLYTDIPGYVDPPIEVPGDIDAPLDLEEDGQGQEDYTGDDTTGLFMSDGTIKAVEPPGDKSYVLGPMMSMFYGWGNFTQIGYVRQSDRKMVNLARITGTIESWDGESNFTSYGQLTLEQAVWFQGQGRQDYRAFYPGPPSNPADEYGRYLGQIISSSRDVTRTIPENPNKRYTPGINRGGDATDNFSLQSQNNKDKLIAGYGLKPDGTMGFSKPGDINTGHDGRKYKLVPRKGYGYNQWVPVEKAGTSGITGGIQIAGVPRNYPGEGAVPAYPSPRGPYTPIKNYGTDKNPKFFPSGPPITPYRLAKKKTMVAQHEPQGKVLAEDRKRILRDVKKPVQVKEIPTKFKVKPTVRKNKTVGADMMKTPETPQQYKPPVNVWSKKDYASNVRESQERKNEVLELVGAAEHHWSYLTEDSRKKKQEKVNEMMAAEFDKQMEIMYEKHQNKEKKTNKVRKYLSDSKLVYDKLDPQSAESMPSTGNPTVDANVKKATNKKEKSRKLKILLGKKGLTE